MRAWGLSEARWTEVCQRSRVPAREQREQWLKTNALPCQGRTAWCSFRSGQGLGSFFCVPCDRDLADLTKAGKEHVATEGHRVRWRLYLTRAQQKSFALGY